MSLSGIAAHGQLFTGSIVGTVTDSSGSVVPNADVAVKNQSTNEVRHLTTDASGHYNFSQLLPGTYSVTVTATGFATFVESGIPLSGSQISEHDPQLHIGSESQTVNVSAASLSLDTESADRTVLIDTKTISALPTSFRNPLFVVNSTAGVVAVRTGLTPYMTDQNQNRFALNGGRDSSSATLVDSASVVSMGGGTAIATPVMDATESVQVQRTAYDPQFTHTDGAAVSLITKRGANDTHGSIFEFIMNNHLNSNSWSNNRFGIANPLYQRNQFGASIGTHIIRDKFFVFGAYEGLRQNQPQTMSGVVPTALEREGDFSQSYNTNGTLRVIYNPFTQVSNGSGGYTRTAFAGNRIPASMMTAIGRNTAALYPLPNVAGATSGQTNWAGVAAVPSNYDKFTVRGDYIFSPKDSLFATYTQAWQKNGNIEYFKNGGDNSDNTGENDYRKMVVLSNTWVPNATWVVNTLVSYMDWTEDDTTPSQGYSAADFGMSSSSVSQFQAPNIFPSFTIENFISVGAGTHSMTPHSNAAVQANITKVIGAHSLRFGFLGEQMRLYKNKPTSANFSFNSGFTAGPTAQTDGTNSGNSIASLLLGTGASGDAPYNASLAMQQYNWGWYLTDSWRATNRLTLNFGMRYEIQGARTERFNRLNYFDPNAVSPLQVAGLKQLTGGLSFTGVGGNGRGLYESPKTNFAPRVSFAYQATDRVVVRGGYGIFYPITYGNSRDTNSDGFSSDTSWVASVGNGGLVPQDSLTNPFPSGTVKPAGSSNGLLTQVGQAVNATFYRMPTPYVQIFSTDVQARLMRDAILEIGYVGTLGRQLARGSNTNLNQLPSQYLSLGTARLNAAVTNPFYGSIASGALSGRTIPYWRTLIAYPQFTSVLLANGTAGSSSNFNALTAKYNQHVGDMLNLIVTYQYSHALDDTSETQGWEVSDAIRDGFNPKLDYSTSAHDFPHSFTGTIVAGLPFGRGKMFFSNVNPVVNSIIGGWELSTIYRFTSGLPLRFTANNALSTYNYTVTRPNVTSYEALSSGTRTLDHWFNTAAITSPGYSIGNVSRFVSSMRRAPVNEADVSLAKSFHLPFRESTFTFRAESYNVSNTPQYAAPNTNLGDGNFGRVTGTTYVGPRQIQFSGRINF